MTVNKKLCFKPLAIAFGLTAMLASADISAQSAKVTTAWNYMQSHELDKAKEAIEEATKDAKTGIQPKTYLYRGQIYYMIFKDNETSDPVYEKLGYDPLALSLSSFMKGFELDPGARKFPELKEEITRATLDVFNSGILAFNANDYAHALERLNMFQETLDKLGPDGAQLRALLVKNKIDPQNLILYQSISASELGMKDLSAQKLEMLVKMNSVNPVVYTSLAEHYKEKLDTAKAISTLEMGMKNATDKKDILVNLLNIYIGRGDDAKALEIGNEAKKTDPENTSIYVAVGSIYDKMGKAAEAEAEYNAALAMKPEDFNSLNSLGRLYYNSGANYWNQSIESKDKVKAGSLESKAKEEWNKALVQFEKAYKVNPKDRDLMRAMSALYSRLGQNQKAQYFLEQSKKPE